MDYLSVYCNGDATESVFHKDPDLRCCSYLAYPEFDESVYDDSEIQLKLCIMELYDFVHNRRNSLKKGNEDFHQFQHSELLKIITEISSIISVCIETKVDSKDSIDVQNSQVQRLTEQKKNIERIGESVGDNEMLVDIVEKISFSIQNKLFCLSKIVNEVEQFSFKQEEFNDIEYGLTPLRIKYPYLTGTYTQLNYNNSPNSPQTTFQYEESKINMAKRAVDNIGMALATVEESAVSNGRFDEYEYTKKYRILQEAERNARINLRNRKNANLKAVVKGRSSEEEYYIVRDDHSHFRNQEDSSVIKASNSMHQEELETSISDKFSGGVTRLIMDSSKIRKSNDKGSLLNIDGWGLIEHHREETPVIPKYKSNFNGSEFEGDSDVDSQKDGKLIIDRRFKLNMSKNKGTRLNSHKEDSCLSDYGSGNTNTTKTNYSRRLIKRKEKNINKGDDSYDEDNSHTNSVRKLRNKFEKDSRSNTHWEIEKEDNMRLVEEFDEWEVKEDEDEKLKSKNNNSNRRNGNKMTSTESGKKNKFRLEFSGSGMPSQYTNTVNRQLSNYRDTMYSTSSWLPLSRNTGFNYNCLNSNSDKNSNKQSGSEYNPAAEYARFSDAVGKVVNPIIADESYRDNGKNIMNPKKLFNAKFGTLTEDTFKEIQEKLRLKMEGWTIHGSGLQDPRANLFWDPAVMAAASTVSPFYTNMPSSNSPLLTNTLIPSSNGIPKRPGFLESIGISRISSHKGLSKTDKPDFSLRSSDLPTISTSPHNPLSHSHSRSHSPSPRAQKTVNTFSSFSSSHKSIPIKSMRELAKRRNK
ncbi:uncharacterized protein ELE39_000209 [Cryptosporidium sp. chipmunk genotype I]|uniref:uncharacterized protein n=1 Tax=Cryptosporidium sp. chipmunk genotype I TaxID=1280935 RepID=UPI00351A0074|nr:hypothetical protein ELE39_000209 [Cryptosporidium sp. chipmunk genotype I]